MLNFKQRMVSFCYITLFSNRFRECFARNCGNGAISTHLKFVARRVVNFHDENLKSTDR